MASRIFFWGFFYGRKVLWRVTVKQKDKLSKGRITSHTQCTKNVIQRYILPVQASQTVIKIRQVEF